jgi:hypothetical protein
MRCEKHDVEVPDGFQCGECLIGAPAKKKVSFEGPKKNLISDLKEIFGFVPSE